MTSDVEKWWEGIPVDQIEREKAELEDQISSAERRISFLKNLLVLHSRRRASSNDTPDPHQEQIDTDPAPAPEPARVTDSDDADSEPGLRGREAVRAVVRANPDRSEWRIDAVLQEILARGWEANTHSVQVNMSRMARDGEFTKPADGRYVPAPILLQSQDGEIP